MSVSKNYFLTVSDAECTCGPLQNY